MGTNYYFDFRGKRFSEKRAVHVGKQSWGWSFSFHGYVTKDEHDARPTCEFSVTPFTMPVRSRLDWAQIFSQYPRGILRDEERRTVKDPVEWVRNLPAPSTAQLAVERGREAGSPGSVFFWSYPTIRDWTDPENFRFYAGEFS